MKNNTNFKVLVFNNVLTPMEMMLIKGGASNSGQNSQGQNNQGSTNAKEDDKRRERPGGGITTQ
jgi:hypothetical protein